MGGATLGLLIGLRLRLGWNRIAHARRPFIRAFGAIALVLFVIAFLAVVGVNTSVLVDRVARIDAAAARNFMPTLLLGMTVLSLVTSLSVAFHHMFMSGDQELLLAAPIR